MQVRQEAVEAVGDRRVHRAPGGVARPEHEVVDQQLGTAAEEPGQRPGALVGVEPVLLVDRDPGQLAALAGQLVPAPRVLLLALQQLVPGRLPVSPADNLVLRHGAWSPLRCVPGLACPVRSSGGPGSPGLRTSYLVAHSYGPAGFRGIAARAEIQLPDSGRAWPGRGGGCSVGSRNARDRPGSWKATIRAIPLLATAGTSTACAWQAPAGPLPRPRPSCRRLTGGGCGAGNRRAVCPVEASYSSTMLAGMRPRSLSSMPCCLAHARMSRLR